MATRHRCCNDHTLPVSSCMHDIDNTLVQMIKDIMEYIHISERLDQRSLTPLTFDLTIVMATFIKSTVLKQ